MYQRSVANHSIALNTNSLEYHSRVEIGENYKNGNSTVEQFVHLLTSVGGSHGLVVMGRDSHSEGRGFKSRHRILDGHFFTCICC